MATATDATDERSLREALDRFLGSDAAGGASGSPAAIVAESFLRELRASMASLGDLDETAAQRIGGSAAESVAASAAWSAAVGERYDTARVCAMLGVSRQALSKRQRSGTLIGLRGRSTTWFPAWQFDAGSRSVRPVVAELVTAFRDRLDAADPQIVAAWATTAQHDDLDGCTPSAWIAQGRDNRAVVRSAEQAALRLAQ